MKKLLATDFDGTFYLNDDDIINNVKSVKEFIDDGNVFAIATGRSLDAFIGMINKYKIPYNYLILNNGATILDKKNNIIKEYYINNNVKEDLISKIDLESHNEMHICGENNKILKLKDENISKINIKFSTFEEANNITTFINEHYYKKIMSYITGSEKKGIDIISYETNKANAVSKIADIEQIDNKNVVVVGDSYNDIEMIKKFNGYCMRNSIRDLIDICNEKIVGSVSELIKKII